MGRLNHSPALSSLVSPLKPNRAHMGHAVTYEATKENDIQKEVSPCSSQRDNHKHFALISSAHSRAHPRSERVSKGELPPSTRRSRAASRGRGASAHCCAGEAGHQSQIDASAEELGIQRQEDRGEEAAAGLHRSRSHRGRALDRDVKRIMSPLTRTSRYAVYDQEVCRPVDIDPEQPGI